MVQRQKAFQKLSMLLSFSSFALLLFSSKAESVALRGEVVQRPHAEFVESDRTLAAERDAEESHESDASPIMEVYIFKLKKGVTEEQFYEKHDRFVEEFLRQQKGFSSSQIWKMEDGSFSLVNTWRNMVSADTTIENFESSEIGSEWYTLIDVESEQLYHFSIERRYF